MQIQRGLVKYKDRTDIVCTYGVMEDGKQYYFLEGGNLPNENIIASTVLVEAIDPMANSSSVGIIDKNGKEIVPFVNRSIKNIANKYLLIEAAKPISQNVLDAIKMRSDPLSATKLVSTAATIKEKVGSKLGQNGRFVFNDQFSEATICDLNGNNLVNNELFSFIGVVDDVLYLSKNSSNDILYMYSKDNGFIEVNDQSINEETVVNNNEEVSFSDDVAGDLDITLANVDKESIDDAMDFKFKNKENDITSSLFDNDVEDSSTDGNNDQEDDSTDDSTDGGHAETVSLNNEDVKENLEKNIDNKEDSKDNKNLEKNVLEDNMEKGFLPEDDIDFADKKETTNFNFLNKNDDDNDNDNDNDFNDDNKENDLISNDLVSFGFDDDLGFDDGNSKDLLIDNFSKQKDSIFNNNLFDDVDESYNVELEKEGSFDDTSIGDDNIIDDVTNTMNNLIDSVKKQRQTIELYDDKLRKAVEAHRRLTDKIKAQVGDIEILKENINNYENVVIKFENKVKLMDEKIKNQESIIKSQKRQLEALKSQLNGKKELAKVLANAQNLLDQDF